MNEDEKYLFDLTGYIVVKNVLDEEALARCNEAIDHYAGGIRERTQSLAGKRHGVAGDHRARRAERDAGVGASLAGAVPGHAGPSAHCALPA